MRKRLRNVAKWMATFAFLASASAWGFTHWYRGFGYSELSYEFGDGVVSAEWTPSVPLSLSGGPHYLSYDPGDWSFKWPVISTRVECKPIYGTKYVWPGKPTRYVTLLLPLWLPALLSGSLCGWLWRTPRLRNNPGRCTACNYDFTGNTSGKCPECGLQIPRTLHLRQA